MEGPSKFVWWVGGWCKQTLVFNFCPLGNLNKNFILKFIILGIFTFQTISNVNFGSTNYNLSTLSVYYIHILKNLYLVKRLLLTSSVQKNKHSISVSIDNLSTPFSIGINCLDGLLQGFPPLCHNAVPKLNTRHLTLKFAEGQWKSNGAS